ncbi:hypothetical protein AGMMS49546_03510 [Spirochaetia bacterium]|nr:hypothetical protein AGMMS49546_03510 [Spirochaetia bacterium]
MKTIHEAANDRILQAVTWISAGAAVLELGVSQVYIKMTRLSAIETTGISLFAFIIFGLVTLFAVTRMKDSAGGKVFAVLMNLVTALAATWYLRMILRDEIFFRNLYYVMNRQTRAYDLLPLAKRITASIPLAGIMLGTAVYYLSAAAILILMFRKNKR